MNADWSGGGTLAKPLTPGGWEHFLGASVYELGPGNFVVYHAHHGSDELVLVLEGRPTFDDEWGEQEEAPAGVRSGGATSCTSRLGRTGRTACVTTPTKRRGT